MLGKSHPVELETTLTSYTFCYPGNIELGRFGWMWRAWGVNVVPDEIIKVTRVYIPKPRWILPVVTSMARGISLCFWAFAMFRFVQLAWISKPW